MVTCFALRHAESAQVNGAPELAALARVSSWTDGSFRVRCGRRSPTVWWWRCRPCRTARRRSCSRAPSSSTCRARSRSIRRRARRGPVSETSIRRRSIAPSRRRARKDAAAAAGQPRALRERRSRARRSGRRSSGPRSTWPWVMAADAGRRGRPARWRSIRNTSSAAARRRRRRPTTEAAADARRCCSSPTPSPSPKPSIADVADVASSLRRHPGREPESAGKNRCSTAPKETAASDDKHDKEVEKLVQKGRLLLISGHSRSAARRLQARAEKLAAQAIAALRVYEQQALGKLLGHAELVLEGKGWSAVIDGKTLQRAASS